tara:strand:+ start:586 stop:1146 length:561 start_codon:yes stop_codon:yes gene_type:complete
VNIIIFGPPGAGKGTQAKILAKKLNSFQVSTGDILRDEIKKDTVIGKKIISNMNNGKFVEDDIVNNLLEKIIVDKKKNELIFDGYPRTVNQAKNLDSLLRRSNQKIDFIFFLNVNKESVVKRIEKRKILEKRTDDESNTILKRYDIYMKDTKPVLDFYSSHKGFHEIDGTLGIDEITSKIRVILNV